MKTLCTICLSPVVLTAVSCCAYSIEPVVEKPDATGNGEIHLFSNTYSPDTVLPELETEHSVVYMPDGSWSYSHHPSVTCFRGKFYAVFSNGIKGEDEPGQRVVLSTSEDFINWSAPEVLLEPEIGDYGNLKILTPGGITVCQDLLTVYYTENDNNGVSDTRLSPELYAIVSPDGERWSSPIDIGLAIFPCHRPLKVSGGRLVMSCNRSSYYTDDPAGLSGWLKSGTASQDQTGYITFEDKRPSLCEGEILKHPDGVLYNLFRNSSYDGYLWQSQSNDNGATWTMPVRSGFSDNNTKSFFYTLDDGRCLYIGTPDNTAPGSRYPLVLALSYDGFSFDDCYILSDDRYEQQYSGRWKGGDYGYPFAYIKDGYAYTVVSRHKERIDAIKCRIPYNKYQQP